MEEWKAKAKWMMDYENQLEIPKGGGNPRVLKRIAT